MKHLIINYIEWVEDGEALFEEKHLWFADDDTYEYILKELIAEVNKLGEKSKGYAPDGDYTITGIEIL